MITFKESQPTQRHPPRNSFHIEPKLQPRQGDNQRGGNVNGKQRVNDSSLKDEDNIEQRVLFVQPHLMQTLHSTNANVEERRCELVASHHRLIAVAIQQMGHWAARLSEPSKFHLVERVGDCKKTESFDLFVYQKVGVHTYTFAL